MEIFDELYTQLNKEQKKAVDTIDGPVFVMAGPGTGKTQILTLRIANILKNTDSEPKNILALTFTNAAAYNMRERLGTIIGAEAAHRVYIATFHSFAEDMVQRYRDVLHAPIGSRFVSPIEQLEILEQVLAKTKTKYFSHLRLRPDHLNEIVSALTQIKKEGMTPDEFKKHTLAQFDLDKEHPDMFYKRAYGEFKAGDRKPKEFRTLERTRDKNLEIADIYIGYEQIMLERGLYDFDDIIVRFVHELQRPHSLLKTELQEQFQYILVDEHQDTNDAQNNILHTLIDNPVLEGKPNLFVVGDSKQAIFRFAGASLESYTRLLQYVRDPMLIDLSSNYRSGQKILSSAHTLITKNKVHQEEQELKAFFDYGGIVEYREFHDYKMELLWVAEDIQKRIDNGENPNEIVVLYPKNNDALELRNLFERVGIAYKDFSKKNILTDPDIQKFFYLIKAVNNPLDNENLAKTLFIDFLPFDIIDVQRILRKAKSTKLEYKKDIISLLENEDRLAEIGIEEERRKHYARFVDFLKKQKQQSQNIHASVFFSEFIRESGFLKYILGQAQSVVGLKKIEKLFDEIKKESINAETFTLTELVDYLERMKKYGVRLEMKTTLADGVSLMTLHGAKGLEFETVYVIKSIKKRGQRNSIKLPFNIIHDEANEDARRLFYVALTRAKKNCFISSYVHNEEGKEKNRSFFIDEIAELTHIDMTEWEKEHLAALSLFFNESREHIVSLIDQEFITERFLKTSLSVSALNNYIESPLKYYFRNLISLPESRSPFLDFGNLVHAVLEEYFNRCIKEQTILTKDIFQSSFESVIEENHIYTEYKEEGWDICESYFDYYKDTFTLPLENEKRINAIPFLLNSGETILLSGVIDKITQDEKGNIVVWDYKTGTTYSEMDKSRKEKTKRQAAFYKLLLGQAYAGRYDFHTAIFDFIEPNKKLGEYERMTFEITQADVDEVVRDINQLADDILKGTLLDKDFHLDSGNKELLEFLEILRGPKSYEQLDLFHI